MKKILYSLVVFSYSFFVSADILIDIAPHVDSNITKYTAFYVDQTLKQGPKEVEKLVKGKKNQKKVINYPHSWNNLWFKLTLKNSSNHRIHRFLSMDGSFAGNYIYYIKENNRWVKKGRFGTSLTPKERPILSTRATLPLSFLPKTTTEIMLKRHSHHLLSIKVQLQDIHHFYEQETARKSQFLMFFGACLIILFINIILYFYNRSCDQLSYIFFMISTTIFLACLNGIADIIYWGITPGLKHYSSIFSAILLFCSFNFMFYYLNLKNQKHYLYKLVYIPLCISPLYIAISILGVEHYLMSSPLGRYLDHFILISLLLAIIILTRSLYDKIKGALFFTSSMITFILPIIFWLFTEFYNLKSQSTINNEIPFLIGTFFCFLLFNIRSFMLFKKSYEKNQESRGDAIISEKYQNIVRMLTHDLSTPLMTIESCIKKLKKSDAIDETKKIIKKISDSGKELKLIIIEMRNKEKESSDIALKVHVEKINLLDFLSRSLNSLPFKVDDYNIEIVSIPNLSIIGDKILFYDKAFYPIISFLISLMEKEDKLVLSCEKQGKYAYLLFKCYTKNETVNILPKFHDELETHFNLEVIDSLEDIQHILEAHKFLNAMGGTIQFQELNEGTKDGISIMLSFSC